MKRKDGRTADEIRELKISSNFNQWAEGSVLIEMGRNKINVTASVEEKLPHHLRGQKAGWITAEYSMLPRATERRIIRPISRGRADGRSNEIQRMIGRIFRSAADLEILGPRTIWLDCDVIQADGSTRTTAINGGFISLKLAEKRLLSEGAIREEIMRGYFAAISVGILNGNIIVDITCEEDKNVSADINIVMFEDGSILEISGGTEKEPFKGELLTTITEKGYDAIKKIIEIEKNFLKEII